MTKIELMLSNLPTILRRPTRTYPPFVSETVEIDEYSAGTNGSSVAPAAGRLACSTRSKLTYESLPT
jgi:hypothetical protein